MAFEYISLNGQLVKVDDGNEIEVKKMIDEIKTEFYFVKLTDRVFVDRNKEIRMCDELEHCIDNSIDDIDWARDCAEDMNGIIYQVVLKEMREEDEDC